MNEERAEMESWRKRWRDGGRGGELEEEMESWRCGMSDARGCGEETRVTRSNKPLVR
jgi:hypothetical protein